MSVFNIEITSKPQVPDDLKIAAESNKLVLFVGAGLSMLGGSPSWDGFSNMMLNSLVKNDKLRGV